MVITLFDYLLSLLFLVFIYLFLYAWSSKAYFKKPLIRKYFLLGLTVKIIGAICIGLVYQYYYGFGDTFGYYRMGVFFSDIISNETGELLNVIFKGDNDYFVSKSYQYGFSSWYAFNPSTVMIARFCTVFSFISFGYYLPTAILFALISFSGVWKLYLTFIKIYPKLVKELAIFILFIPSVFFWGSGILKDSITMGGLGWLTFGFYSFFIARKRKLIYLFICFIAFYIIFSIKPYIGLAYIPAAAVWLIQHSRKQIRSNTTKILLIPLFIGIVILVFQGMQYFLAQEYKEASLTAVIEAATHTSSAISGSDAGSVYTLGTPGSGLVGMLSLVFPAIVVTFFRPFPWEINNTLSLLSAVESLAFLFFSLFILFKIGLSAIIKLLFSNPVILFCFLFALIFAVPVGLASNNFGSLVRYKIPCIPFFAIGLFLIYYHHTGKSFIRQKK